MNNRHNSKFTIFVSLLFLLPPLTFWLVVQAGYRGGIGWIARLWTYLPGVSLEVLIMLLPLPALVLAIIALRQALKQKTFASIIASSMIFLISLGFIILCANFAFNPPS